MIRLPWLLANLVGLVLSGLVLEYFQVTLKEALFLLTFVPVIMGMGGNIGSQTSTITVRGLATGRVPAQGKTLAYLWQQLKVGAIIGLVCSVLVAVGAYVLEANVAYALVVGLSLFLAILVASGSGTLVPVVLPTARHRPGRGRGPPGDHFQRHQRHPDLLQPRLRPHRRPGALGLGGGVVQLSSSEAILLDVVDLGEYDRIVSFLTPEHGRLRGVAKGARRKYSRFAGHLQPLAKVQVTWASKEGRDLVRLSDLDLLRSAEPLYRDLETLVIGGYIADHLAEFAQENEESRRLYRLLDATVEALLGGVDVALATRYFEVWVLRLAGIFPVPVECPQCGNALARDGCGAAARRSGRRVQRMPPARAPRRRSRPRFSTSSSGRVSRALNKVAAGEPTATTLSGVEALCRLVRRAFLQRELKSYRVVQQTLAPAPEASR